MGSEGTDGVAIADLLAVAKPHRTRVTERIWLDLIKAKEIEQATTARRRRRSWA